MNHGLAKILLRRPFLSVATRTVAAEDLTQAGHLDYLGWATFTNGSSDVKKSLAGGNVIGPPVLSGLTRVAGNTSPVNYTGTDGSGTASFTLNTAAPFSISAVGDKLTCTVPVQRRPMRARFQVGYQDPNAGSGRVAIVRFSLPTGDGNPLATAANLTTTNFNTVWGDYEAIFSGPPGQLLSMSIESSTGSPITGCFIWFQRVTYGAA